MESRGKTLFIDVDGTIFKHMVNGTGALFDLRYVKEYLLKDVRSNFNKWHGKGYRLILTTGRCESTREVTEAQLRLAGLFWDLLLMGIGGGERILINDVTDDLKAVAINVPRNGGFTNIDKLYHKAKVGLGAPNTLNKEYEI